MVKMMLILEELSEGWDTAGGKLFPKILVESLTTPPHPVSYSEGRWG